VASMHDHHHRSAHPGVRFGRILTEGGPMLVGEAKAQTVDGPAP
jgi:hypothetical protein